MLGLLYPNNIRIARGSNRHSIAHDTHPARGAGRCRDTGCAGVPTRLFWLWSRRLGRAFRAGQARPRTAFRTPPYEYRVFDVIVSLLFRNGGKARKGNGRNFKLGYGDCTEDIIVGCIAKEYAGKKEGMSVFDPVFVLSAILDWAGIVRNERGYLELTADYCAKAEGR